MARLSSIMSTTRSGLSKVRTEHSRSSEQNEITASIDVIKQEGDDHAQALELDWYMEIHSLEPTGPMDRRREMVKSRVERQKKK